MLELELNLLGMLLIPDHQSQLLPGISIWELSTPEHPPAENILWGNKMETTSKYWTVDSLPGKMVPLCRLPGCNPATPAVVECLQTKFVSFRKFSSSGQSVQSPDKFVNIWSTALPRAYFKFSGKMREVVSKLICQSIGGYFLFVENERGKSSRQCRRWQWSWELAGCVVLLVSWRKIKLIWWNLFPDLEAICFTGWVAWAFP